MASQICTMGCMTDLQRSRDKNAGLALMLYRLALDAGDGERVELARAGLKASGYPG